VSGIAAIFHFDGSAVRQPEIERVGNVLKAYGPDRQKILTQGSAAFAFCLHRLTPEDSLERQPLLLANRFVLLFDGRIDNREELGQSLGVQASELGILPDGEIALRLFDRWGATSFERILGDWAIIVVDLQERRVFCARDHMGLRVLHYYHSPQRFAVASVPEALFALSWVPRLLNKDKVGDTLVQRGLNGETTYYQQIYRVLPGFTINVSDKGLTKVRFWNPEDIATIRLTRDEDYVEALREILSKAVKARLRSWRTPCAQITGGLDSSSISVIAADMLGASGKKLNTFTSVPESGFFREELRGSYFDETPYVRQIAEANSNLTTHFISPSEGPILDQIADQIRLGGAPTGSILNGLWVMDIMAAAHSKGHNVMLSGDMGNITMSYHGRGLFAELLRTGRWLRLFREIRASGRHWRLMLRHWTIAPFIPPQVFRWYKQWGGNGKPPWYYMSVIHPEFAARSGTVDRAASEYLAFNAPPPRNCRIGRIRDFYCYSEAADWFARLRARYGIDFRAPAFDRRLAEFCLGIPVDQYLRDGCERWLMRRAMKGRLPEAILNSKKRGAQAADWHPRLTRELKHIGAKVKRMAGNADLAAIIDLQRLSGILDHWPEHEPPGWSPEYELLLAVPQALGAAYFIENVTGANDRRQAKAG
jgi:asparagine synthase (glutamine-hydrolysing)